MGCRLNKASTNIEEEEFLDTRPTTFNALNPIITLSNSYFDEIKNGNEISPVNTLNEGTERSLEDMSTCQSEVDGFLTSASPSETDISVTPSMNTKSVTAEKTPSVQSLKTTDGCYLVYSPQDNGILSSKYSKTPVDNALAFASLGSWVSIASFKYSKSTPLLSRIHTGSSRYFEAWCMFIKEARGLGGNLTLLPTLTSLTESFPLQFPPMSIYFFIYNEIVCVPKEPSTEPVSLRFIDAVSCVPETYTGFQLIMKSFKEIHFNEFVKCCREPQHGFYLIFTH